MATTIQISEELRSELTIRKLFVRETYEEVIWDILEDTKELSHETKKEIEEARKEINAGKFSTLEEVSNELGL
ncbi:MAG: hypothetical protein ACXQTE_00740 [Methanosarcinaceae archaeon]